ncbi:hypothetical protein GOP47_0008670 [Adiantum capillus-veneris]|uniref:CHCH domain-containing protein n=1 Tax=Adiantum capillus-veneris TaxID=13818 RepID=A0A9D4UYS6_ADICA|nr:hypothetical protein GOP47_0008670 [Adiantum capillus-veneris]
MAETEEAIHAEYPGAETGYQRLSDSMCASHYAASLKCLDDANYNKRLCRTQFEAYRACRKREHELRIERNQRRCFFDKRRVYLFEKLTEMDKPVEASCR